MIKKSKTIVLILCLVLLSLSVVGCTKEGKVHKIYDLVSFKVLFTEYDEMSRYSVEELEAFREITTEKLRAIHAQVFKNGITCETFLVYEDDIYELGIGFGGVGVVDIEISDFDSNGKNELLYTFSWGSGMHRSNIGCFDLCSKTQWDIKCTSDNNAIIDSELLLERKSDVSFDVYTGNYESIIGNDFTTLVVSKDKHFGDIHVEKGNIVFELDDDSFKAHEFEVKEINVDKM